MSFLSNLQLMSQYNQWMNQKLYQAADDLGFQIIQQDRGAFFGSIFGTLNHIYIADIIWLRRFAQHPQQYPTLTSLPELNSYTNLRAIAASSIENLFQLRQDLDKIIINWCQEIELKDLEHNLKYTDTQGNLYCRNFGQLIQHFFNHQTHHRGQATTLFNQQNIDIGVTDLLKIIPEQEN
jgi:uncharacterized damage-inducible protein DinB